MQPLLAQADGTAGGGAPLDQIAIVAVATGGVTLLTLWLVATYRRGGAAPLRALSAGSERLLGIPGWAAVPGIGAIACALITILGATWDIGLHIDVGRDEGPLGTAAHYPLLVGLFGTFQMGLLAIGMAPDARRRSSTVAVRIRGLWPLPVSALVLLAGGTFGFAAFPLDDLWHRLFGQDVTLWGPTHVMIIAGTITGGVGAVLLLVEGARTAGREPFRGGRTALTRPLPALLGGVFLFLWAAVLHEFHWGVPQYRLVWHPLLLAFGAAQALVLARVLGGRGAALGALLTWIPVQLFMTLMIGGPLEVTGPAMPIFVAEVALVELLALCGDWRSPLRFGLASGALIGTVGFAAEYGWSHVAMPIPWPSALLPEGIPVALLAGLAGGTLGALMAQALQGTFPEVPRGRAVAWAAAGVAVLLGGNALVTESPKGVTATMTLTNVRTVDDLGADGRQRGPVADLTVRFSRPGLGEHAEWVSALAWQGKGRYLDHLVRTPDGGWRTTEPVPVGGTWKSFVRVHEGRLMLAAPVRMPRDPAIDFAGFPARPQVARTMVSDQTLLQIERKPDVPSWVWTPAILLVLSLVGALMVGLALACGRLGRAARRTPTLPLDRGIVARRLAPEREPALSGD
jgi:hypothetical protein